MLPYFKFYDLVWDPYWRSGIYKNVNDKLSVILIEDAAHHAGNKIK